MANELAARLRRRIRAGGPITFAAFMEAALYDAAGGFYTRGPRLGRGGAFSTAPTALAFFAEALAAELRALHAALDRPRPFTVVEVGPGDGTLAAGLASQLRDLEPELVLCDRAPGMLEQARARVPGARVAALGELAAVTGAIIANEVHDACPAHVLRWPDELYVEVSDDERFRWRAGEPSRPGLDLPLRAAGIEPQPDALYEVSPAQAELQRTLAAALARGALYVFDYGEAGPLRYTRPVPRLRTYVGGVAGGDPLAAPGTQDITVDVDFGALRAAGEEAGLVTTLDTGQPDWLRAHGALHAAAALPETSMERLWLRALAEPGMSGESFRVLVQRRGVPAVATPSD